MASGSDDRAEVIDGAESDGPAFGGISVVIVSVIISPESSRDDEGSEADTSLCKGSTLSSVNFGLVDRGEIGVFLLSESFRGVCEEFWEWPACSQEVPARSGLLQSFGLTLIKLTVPSF